VLEWVIAFIFSAYVFSFYVDLWPAAATKQQLNVSRDGKGGLHADLSRGQRRGNPEKQGRRSRFEEAGEMEANSSDATLTPRYGDASFESGRAHHHHGGNGAMGRNF
jgi:hypothetical protein